MDILTASVSIGSQLRLKREELQLTLDEVASYLRLKKELIAAIEQDNYHKIPLTYLKGYLRSYAKLLSLSETEAFIEMDLGQHQESAIDGWKVFSSQKQVSSSDKFMQWITYSIISALVLLVVLWWRSDKLLYKNLSANDMTSDQEMVQMANNTIAMNINRGK